MSECNIDKSCFDDVKMCVKVNSVNGIKPNADGEVDIDEKFVTTNTKQTIHGSKTFTNTIKTNGMNTEAMLTTMNGLKIDTAPTVINKSSIKWNDKEQNEVSSIEVSRPANTKDTCISLSANTITEWGSNEKASIDIHAKAGATSYATAPTPSSNATGNEIVTAKWVIDKGLADDTNVVHKTGNETIAGSKTFSNQMYLGGGGTSYGLISAKDNNSILRLFGGTSAGTGANLDLYGENVSSGGFSLRARTSDKIVGLDGSIDGTLKWNGKNVAIDENLVHRSGNETINGMKTFNNSLTFCGNVNKKNNDVDRSVKPTSDISSNFLFVDKNSSVLGYLNHAHKTNGVNHIGLYVKDSNNSDHGFRITVNNEVLPLSTNIYNLGSVSNKWANVYASEINTKYFTYTHDSRTYYSYLPKTSGTLAIQERTRASSVVENRTLLYECAGGLDKGDITLNDVYTKFNALLIVYSDDGGDYMSTYYLDCAELDIRRDEAGSGTFLLVDGHSYWACTGASTGFKFVHATNNGLRIHKIYGLAKYY